MNFDFSDEQKQLQDQLRRMLAPLCSSPRVRRIVDGDEGYDRDVWQALAEMGVLGAAIPEDFGGLGLGHLELCLVAEELGRVLAPVPFASTIGLAAEFLLLAGSDDQKQRHLPAIASGEQIGTFAHLEQAGASYADGRLSGTLLATADGASADFAIVAVAGGLFLVDLHAPGVARAPIATIDPARKYADLHFDDVPAEPLGAGLDPVAVREAVFDRAAILTAFLQLGGADRALSDARDYALERSAFGRPIGSFQAIKHMLADMYVSATLARSNCYYGAWALSTDAREMPFAAAAARVSATQAYQHCARNSIQVHGGMGFTWEHDCHLHYRRANLLALSLGAMNYWEARLLDHLAESRP